MRIYLGSSFVFLPFILISHASATAKISWSSPSPGESFTSSDVINATWTSPTKIISPSFKLCVKSLNSSSASPFILARSYKHRIHRRVPRKSHPDPDEEDDYASYPSENANEYPLDDEEDGPSNEEEDDLSHSPHATSSSTPSPTSSIGTSNECGGAVWPTVKEGSSNGEYTISLAVPALSSSDTFYLVMQSDLGDFFQSPSFTLLSDADASSVALPSPSPSFPLPTSTVSKATWTLSPSPSTSPSDLPTGPLPPIGPLVPPLAHATPFPLPPLATPTPKPSPNEAARTGSKSSTAVAAAVAVPLSVIALAGIGCAMIYLCFKRKQRRNALSKDNNGTASADNLTMLPSSKRSRSSTSSSSFDLEKAIEYAGSSLPLRVPLEQYYRPPHLGYSYPYVVAPPQHPIASHFDPTAYPAYVVEQANPNVVMPPVTTITPPIAIPKVPAPSHLHGVNTRVTLNRTITPRHGTTTTLRSIADQPRPPTRSARSYDEHPLPPLPPASLRPANGFVLPPLETDLTPPPVDESDPYATMQNVLNPYLEPSPRAPNHDGRVVLGGGGVSAARSAPIINYATRPPVNLDVR